MKFELRRSERILADIKKLIYKKQIEITDYKTLDKKIDDGFSVDTKNWNEYKTGEVWNCFKEHRWFRTTITVPEEFDGKSIEYIITTGQEGGWDATNPQMLLYLDGKIKQGIDVNHRRVVLSSSAKANTKYEIAFLAYGGTETESIILKTHLAHIDKKVESIFYDLANPIFSARVNKKTDNDSSRRVSLSIKKAIDVIDLRKPYSEEFYNSIELASDILKKEFYSEINQKSPVVSGVGHTHIDIAWLWTVEQTKEKVLRSFSTVLELMNQYPEYKFMSSQPILYKYVKDQEPEMFEEIKQRVKEGRWEVDGGMWLEADCNIPSGESLVRQVIKGERFFSEEFGITSKSLWLPDVFGYSAALPQIMSKCNINYFMTTKIAWNQYNQLPNDTFMWRGLDGSELFTFMCTACDFDKSLGLNISFTDTRNTTTYTGNINANMLKGTHNRFQNKDLTEDTLMLYGFGDGGGGPTKEMLENSRRLKYGIDGIPRIELEKETKFFDRTYEKISNNPKMPTWDGELYFEYHRGTYTSMGKNKRYNRLSELSYRDLEILSSMAKSTGFEYPEKTIEDGWDIILLNQFHDIIPGTSVEEVYDVSTKEYESILASSKEKTDNAINSLVSNIDLDCLSVVVFNTLSYVRDDVVTVTVNDLNIESIIDKDNNIYSVQYISDNELIFFAKGIPSVGYKSFSLVEGERPEKYNVDFDNLFENDFYIAEFNDKMEILSLVEKETQREFIKDGKVGNKLVTFEDRPMDWDNWDLDAFHKDKSYDCDSYTKAKIIQSGDVRTEIEFSVKFVDSTINQTVYLYNDLARIDFKNIVDWNEHNVMLKTEFPVKLNTNKATYEIQFGNVERETTNNNSWDVAKFETCGHKWADLSENGVGISLLNDCKYGYDIKDGDMRLTLIKAGTYPNPNADIGYHEFTYSIYPHSNRWQEADTIQNAYNLNVSANTVVLNEQKGSITSEYSYISFNKENCFLEAIKKAYDNDDQIIRVYENKNTQGLVKMNLPSNVKEIHECNLLEENEKSYSIDNRQIEFLLKPFEIKSFRLVY